MQNSNKAQERRAYSLAEVAGMMGRHRSWIYRQVSEGRIKTITGFGHAMVTAEEIDRILKLEPESNIHE